VKESAADRVENPVVRLVTWLSGSPRTTWCGLFAITATVFLLTSHWWTGQVSDAIAASWPAWQLAHTGSFDLTGAHGLPDNPFIAVVHGHTVANRTMGVVLIAIPVNLLLAWTGLGAEQTGAITAALATAAAVANMGLVLRAVTTPRRAVLGALLLAFGTSVWTVASAELWTHGPDMLWLSLGLLLLSRRRVWGAGLALAPSITTRPHLAATIAVLGLYLAWRRRSIRPLLALGVPAFTAVGLLVAWNGWYYGHPSIGGAYVGQIGRATALPSSGSSDFAVNVAGSLVSGWCGLLVFSPVIVVLALTLPSGWRRAPAWARAALLGGLVYQVLQFRIDTFNGGGTFYGSRLMIELLVLAAPVVAIGYSAWVADRPWRRCVTTSLAAVSIGVFATGSLLADFRAGGSFSDWTTWYPLVVVRASGPVGLLVVPAVLLVVTLVVRDGIRTARASGQQARLELEQPAEQAVDEGRRVVGGQRPGQLDRLVEHDGVRDVVAPEQLERAEP
jgi:hypothetical protein